MSVKPGRLRQQTIIYYLVSCARCHEEYKIERGTRTRVEELLKKCGWKNKSKEGYICPECLKKDKKKGGDNS
jgi:uncharacterized protein YlaI